MQNRIPLALCALAAALSMTTAHAATVIESVSGPDRTPSLLTVENGKGKQQTDPVNYMLIEPGANRFLYITPPNKQIVDLNAAPPANPKPAWAAAVSRPTKVRLAHKGAGPKVAGYPTQRYQLYANGALCLTTYLSRDAMVRGGLQDFHADFARMSARQKQMQRKGGMEFGPCEDAQDTLATRYPELGLPMRTVDAGGQLRQEVKEIEIGRKVADNLFELPQGFSTITHEEFLRQMEGAGNSPQAPEKAKTGVSS